MIGKVTIGKVKSSRLSYSFDSVRTVQSENLGNANGDLIKLTAHDARPKLLQRVTYPLFDNQDNSER
jgi:hypothetical protein